jgi:hypothetical protein
MISDSSFFFLHHDGIVLCRRSQRLLVSSLEALVLLSRNIMSNYEGFDLCTNEPSMAREDPSYRQANQVKVITCDFFRLECCYVESMLRLGHFGIFVECLM